MPQIGGSHWLYLAFDDTDPTNLEPFNINSILTAAGNAYSTVGTPKTANHTDISENFHLLDIIRDVNVGGQNTTIDTTVREDVKQGFSTSLIAFTEGSMTVQVRYEPTDAAGVEVDRSFRPLMAAQQRKKTIFAVDFDKKFDQLGAKGLAGNWSVSFSKPKPVAGLVVVDWSFALSSKGQWIQNIQQGTHQFGALIEPE